MRSTRCLKREGCGFAEVALTVASSAIAITVKEADGCSDVGVYVANYAPEDAKWCDNASCSAVFMEQQKLDDQTDLLTWLTTDLGGEWHESAPKSSTKRESTLILPYQLTSDEVELIVRRIRRQLMLKVVPNTPNVMRQERTFPFQRYWFLGEQSVRRWVAAMRRVGLSVPEIVQFGHTIYDEVCGVYSYVVDGDKPTDGALTQKAESRTLSQHIEAAAADCRAGKVVAEINPTSMSRAEVGYRLLKCNEVEDEFEKTHVEDQEAWLQAIRDKEESAIESEPKPEAWVLAVRDRGEDCSSLLDGFERRYAQSSARASLDRDPRADRVAVRRSASHRVSSDRVPAIRAPLQRVFSYRIMVKRA